MSIDNLVSYQPADHDRDPNALVERLGEAGCDDALVGIGQPGRLALEFTREADSAEAAVRSALADVRVAVPAARLIEVAPDLVGLTDVADIVGVSRQNMRKLMLAHPGSFPVPVHEGSASIWHLADVLAWLQAKGGYPMDQDVLEVARVALRVNVAKERRRLSRPARMGLAHSNRVLPTEAENGLREVLAGHRVSNADLLKALS